MDAKDNALSESIRELEENVARISERMFTVRMDDFKRAVIGEVNDALREHGDELLNCAPQRMDGFAFCMSRDHCRQQVESEIKAALLLFQMEGAESAMKKVSSLRECLKENSHGCVSKECSEYLVKVLTEAESAFSMARRIQSRMDRVAVSTVDDADVDDYTLTAMAALSNPHRVKLMNYMKGGERAFSEMADHCSLKAGHLQFHMRSLMGLGLMDKGARRGTYMITAEGIAAMQAMQDFSSRIATVKGGQR